MHLEEGSTYVIISGAIIYDVSLVADAAAAQTEIKRKFSETLAVMLFS